MEPTPQSLHTLSTRGTPVHEPASRGKPRQPSLNLSTSVGDMKQTMAVEHKTSADMKQAEHTKLDMYTNEPCGMGMSLGQ